jgi:hypothetical protein
MMRRVLRTVFIIAVVVLALPTPAQAATTSDLNDVGPRLDIRSVSTVPFSHDRFQLTLVFWDPTPVWLLRTRVARIEMSTRGPSHARAGAQYGFRFWPNSSGRLRITYGEAASSCCGRDGAQHPDPFTYSALIRFVPNGSPVKSFRGSTTRRVDCGLSARCGLSGGRRIDNTAWAGI